MPIGGLQKTSLIDYPGKISAVIFIAGCNLKCPYCHNSTLIKGDFTSYKKDTIIMFLKERINFLEGVVISGGEPTLYNKLEELCLTIKNLGYPIKLDTNGTNPFIIENLLKKNLIDYLAMDIKTVPNLYSPIFWEKAEPEKIIQSIKLIKNAQIPYEFRTTCSKKIITENIIEKISQLIQNAELYVLQLFNNKQPLDPNFFKDIKKNYNKKDLINFKAIAEKMVKRCIIR